MGIPSHNTTGVSQERMMTTTTAALTAAQIPCCLCGTLIYPNEANQCAACLAQAFDLQAHLQRGPGGAAYATVHQCRECRRFERKPGVYEMAEPESPGLLAICLKQLPALQSSSPQLHLVDAAWIWTEPHSMRFRLCLTVRAELSSVLVEQRCRVELHCAFQPCPECHREATKRTWHAIVQVRQKRPHNDSPGITRIEQAIGQNKDLRQHVLKLDDSAGGLDFYFLHLSHAQTFVHSIQRLVPLRVSHTTVQQVSTNVQNHTAHRKHTITCDLAPLWEHDLLYVAPSATTARHLAGRLWLVEHVGEASWRWMDVGGTSNQTRMVHVSSTVYTRLQNEPNVLRIVATPHRWHAYTVLDVEDDEGPSYAQQQQQPEQQQTIVVQVVSSSNTLSTAVASSALGQTLEAGDTVWGYNVAAMEEWNVGQDFVRHYALPDVVLVQKANDDDAAVDGAAEDEDVPASSTNGRNKKHSKRKERKKRKENKRMRELELRAERMGLLGESSGFAKDDDGEDVDLEEELAALDMGANYDDANGEDTVR